MTGPAVTPVTVLGVALALTAVGAGAYSLEGELVHHTQRSSSAYAAVAVLDVDGADVAVTADSGDGVRLTRTDRWSFARPQSSAEVVGTTLRLRSRCPALAGRCSVSYVVHVPAATTVRVRAGSGDVDARGLAGLDARTGSGTIRVSDPRGALTLQTGSGDLEVFGGATGPTVVETASGDASILGLAPAELTLRTGEGDAVARLGGSPDRLDLQSGAGDLALQLPDDGVTAYAVRATSGAGDVRVDLRQDPASGRRLTARTGSGDVRLTYAP